MTETQERTELNVYDEFDKRFVEDCMEFVNTSPLPMVGEFVLLKDGSIARIAYVMGNQAVYLGEKGVYFLGLGYTTQTEGKTGHCITCDHIKLTDEKRPGDFWFYHHNTHLEENKVTRIVMLRVWREV